MARYLTDPSVAAAIAAFDLRAYRRALEALVPATADDTEKTALRRLQCTVRPFARKMTNRLPLFLLTWAGCGFRLIGEEDRLAGTQATVRWFTLLFLPIWPLRGYLVRESSAYQYEYLAEIPFDPRFRWAPVVIPGAIALLTAVLWAKGAL